MVNVNDKACWFVLKLNFEFPDCVVVVIVETNSYNLFIALAMICDDS